MTPAASPSDYLADSAQGGGVVEDHLAESAPGGGLVEDHLAESAQGGGVVDGGAPITEHGAVTVASAARTLSPPLVDERAARAELRRQIGRLEHTLGQAVFEGASQELFQAVHPPVGR